MSKKLIISFLICLIFIFPLFANEQNVWQDRGILKNETKLVKIGHTEHRMGVVWSENEKGELVKGVTDTMQNCYDDYYGGEAIQSYQTEGDTAIERLNPMNTGQLLKIQAQFFEGGTGDWNVWYLWDPADPDAPGSYPAGAGELLWSMPWTVATTPEDGTWEELDLQASGLDLEVGQKLTDSEDYTWINDFFVGYALGVNATPKLNMDAGGHDRYNSAGNSLVKSLTTLHGQGTGWYLWGTDETYVNWKVRVIVYYDSLGCVFDNIPKPSDSFDDTKTVSADVEDLDGSVVSVNLYYGAGTDTTYPPIEEMTEVADLELVGDANDIVTVSGEVSGSVGDKLWYYFVGTDDQAIETKSPATMFEILDPGSTDRILVLDGHGTAAHADTVFQAVKAYSEDVGLDDPYLWVAGDRGGYDYSVINAGWSFIYLNSWADDFVPFYADDLDEQGFGDFLDNGGKLIYTDMDYAYAHGHDPNSEGSDVLAGTPARDWFGVSWVLSDPDDGGDPPAGISDIEFAGYSGSDISNPWSSSNYGPIVYHAGWPNWGDYLHVATEAEAVFEGASSGEIMGIATDMAIYLAFHPELNIDQVDYTALVANMIDYLGGVCMKGDVVKDGDIAVTDIVRTVAIILMQWDPSDYELCAADMNNDGEITVADIVAIVNIILGNKDFSPASSASLQLQGTDIILNSDGDIGGIQFALKSNSGLEINAAPGVKVAYNQVGEYTNVVVYTMNKALPENSPFVTLNQVAELTGEMIAADRSGANVPVKNAVIISDYSLSQNYPNPFNPTTNILYQLPENIHVNIAIYNVLGQRVETLVNSKQDAGIYSVKWNGKDRNGLSAPAGIYFCKMHAGSFNAMKKMFFIK